MTYKLKLFEYIASGRDNELQLTLMFINRKIYFYRENASLIDIPESLT